MLTKEEVQGGWTEMKGKIKEMWGQVNDDELLDFEGDFDQLVGMIHSQTGQSKKEIEQQLNKLNSQLRPMLAQAQEYMQETRQKAMEMAGQVRDSVAAGHEGAQEMVRQRPVQSLAVVFGTGLVAGLVVGLMLRSR
jgi:uncharacterized protein YjbJ (UPF0337 family)